MHFHGKKTYLKVRIGWLTPQTLTGLGRALVGAYLARPDNVVVAAVRDPAHHTARSLRELPKAESSSLIIVKIDSTSGVDAAEAVTELSSAHDITDLDVVIDNAGVARIFPKVQDARTSDFLDHYRVNAIGVVILFQAVLPFLKRSQMTAKFIAIGSAAGTIADMEKANIPNAVYGTSKAALNYLVKKIHLENEDIVAFPVHPG